MAPLFEHYGIQLWTPEVGGRVDSGGEDHEQTMMALGLQSKREITRTKIRVRTAMAAQTREHDRYLGGRPPYGYRLAGGMDLRGAPGRAQHGPDRPRPQRRRGPMPVGRVQHQHPPIAGRQELWFGPLAEPPVVIKGCTHRRGDMSGRAGNTGPAGEARSSGRRGCELRSASAAGEEVTAGVVVSWIVSARIRVSSW